MVDLAGTKLRREAVDKIVDRRTGVLPERRDTRAPALSPSGTLRSASRGDGGAEELMRTLGMVGKAADGFQDYAERRFKFDEAERGAQGAIDQAAGQVDEELAQKSYAYRNSVALGRTMTTFQSGLQSLDEDLRGVIENQDDPDLGARQGEVKKRIDDYFKDFAMDPESGQLRSFLATPEAKRWLAGSMTETRSKLEASALGKIEERFKGEALTHAGTILGAQIDAGSVDLAGLRKLVPATVSDDDLRATILTTFQGKAEQLKAEGRYEEAYRSISQLLEAPSSAIRTIEVPASTAGAGGALAASAAATARLAPVTPTATRRRSRDEVINFVLMDLEGGDAIVDNRDGGGTTKFGFTQRHNPDVDVAKLTPGQAKGLAKSRYWQEAYDNANPATAAIAFDAGFINSKSFARELATKYANDPVGALGAYRKRLQDIAKKPDKARFLTAWMNRVDRLGTYLGVGPGGQGSDNVIDDPTFALDDEPLDPVEAYRANPGSSLAPQLAGGLALRPQERTRLLEYRDQLGREVKQEWQRKVAERQDENSSGFLLRLSGLGEPLTPSEIADAARRRDITPQQTATLLGVIRSDADRDEARAERAANEAERDRDKADEQTAQGITASLMGPVYSGQRSTGEALRLFSLQASGLDPKVRRAVLGAMTAEANGIEEVRKNNPALRSATDALDDGEQEALRRIRGPYRTPQGRTVTAEQQRALISLEFAKAKRTLFQTAIDKGDIGTLPDQLARGVATKIRPYLTTPATRR